jgi:photosynthetic reaction center cytochrome c subunit
MSRPISARIRAAALGFGALVLLAGCERFPVDSTQSGYRGTGMVQIDNPRIVAQSAALHVAPAAPPVAPPEGPRAKEVFKNVKVLGELSVGEFTRLMTSMTEWVSPTQGCGYCHNLQDLADDSVYTKVVARRMLQMTGHINADWKQHVAATGVTCYTCHRGQPVPSEAWFAPAPQKKTVFIGDDAGQNKAAMNVGLTSLPYDPYGEYLDGRADIRVQGDTPLPTGNERTIMEAEHTYGLMMTLSKGLGVNCTFCHNSRSFASWEGPPQRVTAYHGIRMARDLNSAYLGPLAPLFPAAKKGPTGDVGKVACATCHLGVSKPLNGAPMLKDHPELTKVALSTVAMTAKTAPLPEPVAEARRSVLYFAVGSAVLEGPQEKGLAKIITTMSGNRSTRATISGYHSAAGTLAANQELAKQRAFTVRDALLAAGISPNRVVLAKPVQTEANVSGEDPTARRVEVTVGR